MRHGSTKKVLLIGWDAADWKVIHPLLDEGKMPNLEGLINQGVMGNLATLYPDLSPMLWTSIATGKRPFKHGIYGFTEPDPRGGGLRPITNLSRKTKAIWNILSQAGRKCVVVSWWPSHPAEPINGVMVSNHYQRAVGPIDKPWPMRPGTVHPPRLIRNLAELRVHPQQLKEGHILPFVPRAGDIDQEKEHGLENVAKIISESLTVEAASLAILHHEPWDFAALYFDGIDHFCHGFMQFHPPRLEWVSEEEFRIYREVVAGGYIHHDIMLGHLLQEAGEETTVLLVSDHGFHSDHLRPRQIPLEPAGPAAQHRHYGIVVMKGPGIKHDETIYGAMLLDICPTVLVLSGVPVGTDMDGKPLVDAFEQTPAVETIPSWDEVPGEAGTHPPDRKIDPIEAREAINQLVALGYIEEPPEDREKAVAEVIRELDYNLARSYMDANRHEEAAALLEKLLADWPYEHRFGVQLVTCYQALDRLPESRQLLQDMFRRKEEDRAEAIEELKSFWEEHKEAKPEDLSAKQHRQLRQLRGRATRNPYAIHYLLGRQCFAEGDQEAALEHFQRAEQADPGRPDLHLKLGDVYLKMKRWEDAERSYRQVLEMDPDSAVAHRGLAQSFLPRNRNVEAAEEALSAVGLVYHNPLCHYLLGVALHRLNFLERAVEALQVAISQNANYPDAHRRLARIYKRTLNKPDEADRHHRLAEEASRRISTQRKKPVPEPVDEKQQTPLTVPVLQGTDSASMVSSPEDALPATGIASEFVPGETIVIVSGLPRSGTSLMMQMLQAGGLPVLTDGERAADEDNLRGYFEFKRAKALPHDQSWLAESRGHVVKLVAQLLPFLGSQHDYRIVFMERNMDEVIRSQQTMLTRQNKTGAHLPVDKLAGVFAGQVKRVKKMLNARQIPTLYVNFRTAIQEPAQVAAQLNDFLGGVLDEQAMTTVVEPSLCHQSSNGS